MGKSKKRTRDSASSSSSSSSSSSPESSRDRHHKKSSSSSSSKKESKKHHKSSSSKKHDHKKSKKSSSSKSIIGKNFVCFGFLFLISFRFKQKQIERANIKPITEADYFIKSVEFRRWLHDSRSLRLNDLVSEQQKKEFKKVIAIDFENTKTFNLIQNLYYIYR